MITIGENINIGFGLESTRGTPVAPSIWIQGRTPTGLSVMTKKVLIKETRGSKISSQASEKISEYAEGSLEFNLKSNSLGYILKSLLGSVSTSTLETGVYQHIFSVLVDSPLHPALTLALAQQASGFQDYQYPLALAKQLAIKTPVNDVVNAVVDLVASKENEVSDYTPGWVSNDYLFRVQDVTIKFASALSGLNAAAAVKPKELEFTINNNARIDQNIGELNPSDVIALILELSGKIKFDYKDKTYHDAYKNATYRAMRIQMKRTDITIGLANNPTVTIDLAKTSFEGLKPDRPIDDIVKDDLTFNAHYSDTDSKAITVTLVNEIASY